MKQETEHTCRTMPQHLANESVAMEERCHDISSKRSPSSGLGRVGLVMISTVMLLGKFLHSYGYISSDGRKYF